MKLIEILKRQEIWKKAGIILFWFFIWQAVQLAVDNYILLAGPIQVAEYLLSHIFSADFWEVVYQTVFRIGWGFLLAFLMGVSIGACSYRFPFLKELLQPLISIFKSIPVASFVVLVLIWFGAKSLSFFCSFLVAFPNVYESMVTGLSQVDERKKEVLDVYQASFPKKIVYLYMPAVLPYLQNSCKTCLGMSMKSGVAAEVIGTPDFSIGEKIYMAKIYLDTPGIMAWTVVVIAISFFMEKGFLWLLHAVGKLRPFLKGKNGEGDNSCKKGGLEHSVLSVKNLCKSYGNNKVLKGFSLSCKKGSIYCIMGPSGIGKTTFLSIMAGLEQPDSGSPTFENSWRNRAMVFQESRLFEELSAIDNVMVTVKKTDRITRKKAEKELALLLPKDCLNQPVKLLSGGMKRRVELVRAMITNAGLILLDEPFTGLDKENKQKAAAYIQGKKAEKIIMASIHSEEEGRLLQGIVTVL